MGGMVALLVVRLTNAQQTRSFERSIELSAIADFVSIAEGLLWDLNYDPDDEIDRAQIIGQQLVQLRAASVRLEMASRKADPVVRTLRQWHLQLGALVIMYQRAFEGEEPYTKEIKAALWQVISALSDNLPNCASPDPKVRASAVRKFHDSDKKLVAFLRDFETRLG